MNDIKTPGEGWRPSREDVAAIIDPVCFRVWDSQFDSIGEIVRSSICRQRDEAFAKADAILALSLSPLLVEGKENKELGESGDDRTTADATRQAATEPQRSAGKGEA